MYKPRSPWQFAVAVTGLFWLVTGCSDNQRDITTTTDSASKASTGASRVIYIDPETGERASPPAGTNLPRQDTESGKAEKAPGLKVIPLEDGSFRVTREGGFRVNMYATVQPDGSLKIEETMDEEKTGE